MAYAFFDETVCVLSGVRLVSAALRLAELPDSFLQVVGHGMVYSLCDGCRNKRHTDKSGKEGAAGHGFSLALLWD